MKALSRAAARRTGIRFALAILCTAAPAFSAEKAARPPETRSFYRAPLSYGTTRDPDPPAFTRHASDAGIAGWENLTWLDIGLGSRFRIERRDDDLRRAEPGLDTPLLIRTRAYLGIHDVLDPFRFAVEFQDSRRYGSRFEPDNRNINEFDLTGLYAELYFREALGRDALNHPRPLSLRAGRMNFEFLDRRLLGNNQWRGLHRQRDDRPAHIRVGVHAVGQVLQR